MPKLSNIKDEDFEPITIDGKLNAPKIGERCIFLLHSWHGRPVSNFRIIGYREDDALIYAPLYRQSLSMLCVKGWYPIGGEPFYNGRFGGAK